MRHIKLAAAGGTLAAAALACCGPAVAQAATSGAGHPAAISPNSIVGRSVDQSWTQLNTFWTSARTAAAKADPLPASGAALPAAVTIPAGTQETAPATLPAASAASAAVPASLPGKTSRVWTNHKSLPATAIGKLFFFTGTGTASCTATIVNAPNKDTIWTAAHCVSDGHGHEYEDFVFKPNLNGSSVPLGSFKAKYISAPAGYVDQDLVQYDYAAIALSPNIRGKAQNLAGAEGWIMGGNTYKWASVSIFGYPSIIYPSKRPVNNTQLRYCTGSTSEWKFMMQFQCDMGQGSSGGPLIYRLTSKTGWVVGNVSNGDNKGTVRSPQLSAVALAALKLAYKR
jgi:V8-like Glu-specific endopeptidase